MLLLATGNGGKQAEFRALLAPFALRVCGSRDVAGGVAFPEEGADYVANAVAKARAGCAASGWPALADDSGLEVLALGGAPGVHSARYGGSGLSARERCARLLAELAEHEACAAGVTGARRDAQDSRAGGRGSQDLRAGEFGREARFVCVVALALPSGGVRVRRGELAGSLLRAPRGDGGFGYDPIFQPAQPGAARAAKTLAELGAAEKNRISHRARALAALAPELARLAAGVNTDIT